MRQVNQKDMGELKAGSSVCTAHNTVHLNTCHESPCDTIKKGLDRASTLPAQCQLPVPLRPLSCPVRCPSLRVFLSPVCCVPVLSSWFELCVSVTPSMPTVALLCSHAVLPGNIPHDGGERQGDAQQTHSALYRRFPPSSPPTRASAPLCALCSSWAHRNPEDKGPRSQTWDGSNPRSRAGTDERWRTVWSSWHR
jgi:hypothetical protein